MDKVEKEQIENKVRHQRVKSSTKFCTLISSLVGLWDWNFPRDWGELRLILMENLYMDLFCVLFPVMKHVSKFDANNNLPSS